MDQKWESLLRIKGHLLTLSLVFTNVVCDGTVDMNSRIKFVKDKGDSLLVYMYWACLRVTLLGQLSMNHIYCIGLVESMEHRLCRAR